MSLHFSDLTDKEIEILCNGCGPKSKFIKIPQFLFIASCDHHDFKYWVGCTDEDRKIADDQFYEAMKKDVDTTPYIFRRYLYGIWAWSYYTAVRACGWAAFSYGKRKRTREDLDVFIEGKLNE